MVKATEREIAPRITVDPKVRFGKPVIAGTRVDVATVLGHLAAGDTVEDIVAAYGVAREDVLAAIEYAAQIVSSEDVRATG